MEKLFVNLNSVEVVKEFVNVLTKLDGDFDLISGRYVINAKSIMGIFSLDLTKPIELKIPDLEFDHSVLDKFLIK